MDVPTDWDWDHDNPTEVGWHAIVYMWDPEEGSFFGTAQWDGSKWLSNYPITGFAGPFPTQQEASDWADAHEW